MKPTCPKCGSENLDQGVGETILCHGDGTNNCDKQFKLIETWVVGL